METKQNQQIKHNKDIEKIFFDVVKDSTKATLNNSFFFLTQI